MRLRVLLDENVEADLGHKLIREGHDVERVVDVEELGPGADDAAVRGYARDTERILVTYDDHFADPDGDHAGVFYCPEQHLDPFDMFRIIATITDSYERREDLPPVDFLSTNWLRLRAASNRYSGPGVSRSTVSPQDAHEST